MNKQDGQIEIGEDITKGIKPINIVDEMKKSYINYSMSVIVSRALPDVRDGLKPVQRRILYAMYKLGILPSSAYRKSANTVGEVMAKYHPHGDQAIYDTLVRMAQDFSFRYTLINGQGNFGSIDGDKPAAMRYTEAKLEKFSLEILSDIEKNTVRFDPNYDGNYKEPSVLPTKVPTLLLNGVDGIAVGMATKIPPHNLGEIIDAINYMIDKGNTWKGHSHYNELRKNREKKQIIPQVIDPDELYKNVTIENGDSLYPIFESEARIDELMNFIKGPDFPTSGVIYDKQEIEEAYATGRGRILMRGVAKIEEYKKDKYRIIITEIPFQVNKAHLVAKIANLYREKKIDGIKDLRDESNREGIRIVIELRRDSKPKTVLNKLFKYTEMQKVFNANMLALVDNEPGVLPLKRILELFITHRQEVVIRKNEYDLANAQFRAHILEGLKIALDNLDEVISTIRNSKDQETAKENLIKKFKLTEIQAKAILEMQLRRLAALERKKIEDEFKEIIKLIGGIEKLLNNPIAILNNIKNELSEIKEKFGDKRRTKVNAGKVGEFSEEDLVKPEDVIVTITKQGYIKRMPLDNYHTQRRGGKGKKGITTKEGDVVEHIFKCNTHDEVLFFTNKGRAFQLKVYDIPEFSRTAKGQPVINLIDVEQGELVTSILTRSKHGILSEDVIQEEEEISEKQGRKYKYLLMATKKGTVKKTDISQFDNIRSSGLIAIKLKQDDELSWVRPTTGNSEVILVTKKARSIRFSEKDVRSMGRASAGVRGIKFKDKNDEVIVMDVIRKGEDYLLTVSENGYGKMTEISEHAIQKRGGQGVFAFRITKKTSDLVCSRILDHPEKELLILSEKGIAIMLPIKDGIPVQHRQTSGVRLMRLRDKDRAAAITIM